MKALIALVATLLATATQAQVYKCEVGGKKVFSDKPCAVDAQPIQVRPATGSTQAATGRQQVAPPAPAATEVPTGSAAPISLSDRASNLAKRRSLKDQIYRKEIEADKLEKEMQDKIQALRNQRRYANNNLAGATWQNSLAEEMNAVADSYGTRIQRVRADVDRLRADRDAIPE